MVFTLWFTHQRLVEQHTTYLEMMILVQAIAVARSDPLKSGSLSLPLTNSRRSVDCQPGSPVMACWPTADVAP